MGNKQSSGRKVTLQRLYDTLYEERRKHPQFNRLELNLLVNDLNKYGFNISSRHNDGRSKTITELSDEISRLTLINVAKIARYDGQSYANKMKMIKGLVAIVNKYYKADIITTYETFDGTEDRPLEEIVDDIYMVIDKVRRNLMQTHDRIITRYNDLYQTLGEKYNVLNSQLNQEFNNAQKILTAQGTKEQEMKNLSELYTKANEVLKTKLSVIATKATEFYEQKLNLVLDRMPMYETYRQKLGSIGDSSLRKRKKLEIVLNALLSLSHNSHACSQCYDTLELNVATFGRATKQEKFNELKARYRELIRKYGEHDERIAGFTECVKLIIKDIESDMTLCSLNTEPSIVYDMYSVTAENIGELTKYQRNQLRKKVIATFMDIYHLSDIRGDSATDEVWNVEEGEDTMGPEYKIKKIIGRLIQEIKRFTNISRAEGKLVASDICIIPYAVVDFNVDKLFENIERLEKEVTVDANRNVKGQLKYQIRQIRDIAKQLRDIYIANSEQLQSGRGETIITGGRSRCVRRYGGASRVPRLRTYRELKYGGDLVIDNDYTVFMNKLNAINVDDVKIAIPEMLTALTDFKSELNTLIANLPGGTDYIKLVNTIGNISNKFINLCNDIISKSNDMVGSGENSTIITIDASRKYKEYADYVNYIEKVSNKLSEFIQEMNSYNTDTLKTNIKNIFEAVKMMFENIKISLSYIRLKVVINDLDENKYNLKEIERIKNRLLSISRINEETKTNLLNQLAELIGQTEEHQKQVSDVYRDISNVDESDISEDLNNRFNELYKKIRSKNTDIFAKIGEIGKQVDRLKVQEQQESQLPSQQEQSQEKQPEIIRVEESSMSSTSGLNPNEKIKIIVTKLNETINLCDKILTL